jgi:hypothetical protein
VSRLRTLRQWPVTAAGGTVHVVDRERDPNKRDMDERVSIPLDPKTTLKALLATPPPDETGKRKPKKKPAKS